MQTLNAPATEPERQNFFIEKCARIVEKKEAQLGRKLTASVNTYGCQMNAKDSEKLSGILKKIGYTQADSENADLVLYNTCTVRENANNRVWGHLGLLKNLKKKNPGMIIVLCGCMMQEEHVIKRIKKDYRHVDIVFGTHNIYMLAELLFEKLCGSGETVISVLEKPERIVENLPAERKYPFKAGVNIMYGCDNFCTYCIVPYVRGMERSRDPDEIIAEIKALARDGVIEVMLLGQNVNSYGRGLDKETSFAKLLRDVTEIDGIRRIRFMTSHPKDLSDELIDVMAGSQKICRQLHLPLQSGSTKILKRMNRSYSKEDYLALAERIRKRIPDIALSTDIMVGFPGETDEDFLETVDVIERVGFEAAYTFIYSKREGTPAAKMDGQIPPEIVKERFSRLLAVINKSSSDKAGALAGSVADVLVEGKNEKEEGLLTGRLSNNMLVYFKGDESLVGKIIDVRLDEAKGFYFLGTAV